MALHQSNPVDTLYDIHRNFPIKEEIDSIKNILNTLELHSRHYEVLSVDTTGPTFWIAVIGVILSAIAAYYGYKGYKYQREAADSLKSISARNIQFEEYIGYFHQNLVNLLAIRYMVMKNSKPKGSTLDKILIPDTLVNMDSFQNNASVYRDALELKVDIRNFNYDVQYLKTLLEAETIDRDIVYHEIGRICYRLIMFIVMMAKIDVFSSNGKPRVSILTPDVVAQILYSTHIYRVGYRDFSSKTSNDFDNLPDNVKHMIRPILQYTSNIILTSSIKNKDMETEYLKGYRTLPKEFTVTNTFAANMARSNSHQFSFSDCYETMLKVEVAAAVNNI